MNMGQVLSPTVKPAELPEGYEMQGLAVQIADCVRGPFHCQLS